MSGLPMALLIVSLLLSNMIKTLKIISTWLLHMSMYILTSTFYLKTIYFLITNSSF
jgi:hypothetical protein